MDRQLVAMVVLEVAALFLILPSLNMLVAQEIPLASVPLLLKVRGEEQVVIQALRQT